MNKAIKVSELVLYLKSLVKRDMLLSRVKVMGHISNISIFQNYSIFNIKSDNYSIKCIYFTDSDNFIKKEIVDDDQIIIDGNVTVYEKNGSCQLNVKEIDKISSNNEDKSLKILYDKLKKEGIFDRAKNPIPSYPCKIGLISSGRGAAIHDILSVVYEKKYPLEIFFYPSMVQGQNSVYQIECAVKELEKINDLDFIILTRGGGDTDDLSTFNDEKIIRLISKSKIPVVSAIGHYINNSLVDLVADASFSTPTKVAQILIPDLDNELGKLSDLKRVLDTNTKNIFENRLKDLYRNKLLLKSKRPDLYLDSKLSNLSELKIKLKSALINKINIKNTQLLNIKTKLYGYNIQRFLDEGLLIAEYKGKLLKNENEFLKDMEFNLLIKKSKINCKVLSKEFIDGN